MKPRPSAHYITYRYEELPPEDSNNRLQRVLKKVLTEPLSGIAAIASIAGERKRKGERPLMQGMAYVLHEECEVLLGDILKFPFTAKIPTHKDIVWLRVAFALNLGFRRMFWPAILWRGTKRAEDFGMREVTRFELEKCSPTLNRIMHEIWGEMGEPKGTGLYTFVEDLWGQVETGLETLKTKTGTRDPKTVSNVIPLIRYQPAPPVEQVLRHADTRIWPKKPVPAPVTSSTFPEFEGWNKHWFGDEARGFPPAA